MLHIGLKDLQLFRHVAEAGSITRGAERAHLALAAASTRIRDMEAEIGAPLLVRERQGVTLTQAGRALLVHARTILAQRDRMEADLGAYAGGAAGELRILSNTNAISEFLPEALGTFLAAHPRLSIDIEERLSDEIVGLVAGGVASIGIVAATVETAGLETFPFRRDRFVVVTHPGHPIAERRDIAFSEVLAFDHVGLDRASALQRFLSARAAREGRPIRLRVQLRSFDGICRLVEAGVGIGIVPETTARRAAHTMALATVALADAWAVRDLTIVVRAYADLPPVARLLVDHLRQDAKADEPPGVA